MATILQTTSGHTTTNGQTPLVLLPSATTPGTMLLLFVAVEGTATPGITTPTNWTLLGTSGGTTQTLSVFQYLNNPGGITNVSIAFTSHYGGVAIFVEDSDTTHQLVEFVDSGGATAANFPATITGQQTTPPVLYYGEEWYVAYAWNASATFTGAFTSPGWVQMSAEQTSLLGTQNITMRVYRNVQQYNNIGLTAGGVAPSASVDRSGALARFLTQNAQALTLVGEPAAIMSQGYSGALGGL